MSSILFQHAAHCVLVMSGKLFLFININFHIFPCQSLRCPSQGFCELHGGHNRLTAAETGSCGNDCRPQCTLGNNQPSFVIIAGKSSCAVVLAVGHWQQQQYEIIFHLFFLSERAFRVCSLWLVSV